MGDNNSRGVYRGSICPVCGKHYTLTNFMRLKTWFMTEQYGYLTDKHQVSCFNGRKNQTKNKKLPP